jgi:glycerophosphoryl diester phosphodiesterase
MFKYIKNNTLSLSFFLSVFICLFVMSDICLSFEIHPSFIAHAGGAINGRTATNSLEALNDNYNKGHRFFEVDFCWTSDDNLVAIHDWGEESSTFREMYFVPDDIKVPTKDQFLGLKSKLMLTQLSLKDVLEWAKQKGDAFIITDIKSNNIRGLEKICSEYKSYKKHIIPQVYSYDEYDVVKHLGYKRIILTLYKMITTDVDLLKFSIRNRPYAVTMHWSLAQTGLADYLYKNNIKVYAHTVNDIHQFKKLQRIGIFGVYTDVLGPL